MFDNVIEYKNICVNEKSYNILSGFSQKITVSKYIKIIKYI